MNQTPDQTSPLKVLDRKDVRIILNAVLFAANFILIYFLWLRIFPHIAGYTRLILCWIGAYAFTWAMTRVTGGPGRLVLSMLFVGLVYFVFHFTP